MPLSSISANFAHLFAINMFSSHSRIRCIYTYQRACVITCKACIYTVSESAYKNLVYDILSIRQSVYSPLQTQYVHKLIYAYMFCKIADSIFRSLSDVCRIFVQIDYSSPSMFIFLSDLQQIPDNFRRSVKFTEFTIMSKVRNEIVRELLLSFRAHRTNDLTKKLV